MNEPASHKDIIRLWSSADAMGVEIGAGVFRPRKWLTRGRIPPAWFGAITDCPTGKAAGLTLDKLTKLETAEAANA